MVRIFIGLAVVALALLIYCMVECLQTPRHQVRVLPKAAWVFIILLLPLLGPGLWLAFGKARGRSAAPQRRGPAAPDDDPEFLRRVEVERRQQQRREEEARKRAEEQRRKRGTAGPQGTGGPQGTTGGQPGKADPAGGEDSANGAAPGSDADTEGTDSSNGTDPRDRRARTDDDGGESPS